MTQVQQTDVITVYSTNKMIDCKPLIVRMLFFESTSNYLHLKLPDGMTTGNPNLFGFQNNGTKHKIM